VQAELQGLNRGRYAIYTVRMTVNDPLGRSWELQRTSDQILREAASLRARAGRLIQRGRDLRERIEKFLQPHPPTSSP
jgi:hypothetical protein